MEDAVNLLQCRLRIVQNGRSHGQLIEDPFLRVELAHLVMEERILFPLAHARRAADDDDGRFFRVGLGGGVGDLQPAHAISHADHAQAADARIGIGGEAGALFIASGDDLQRAFLQGVVETQHVIARNAKDMADAQLGAGVRSGNRRCVVTAWRTMARNRTARNTTNNSPVDRAAEQQIVSVRLSKFVYAASEIRGASAIHS